MNSTDIICQPCQHRMQVMAGIDVSLVHKTKIGVFIDDLGPKDTWHRSDCKLCELLFSAGDNFDNFIRGRLLPITSEEPLYGLPADSVSESNATNIDNDYVLRAFSFFKNYDGTQYNIRRRLGICDSLTLAVVPASFNNHENSHVLKSYFWSTGHLIFRNMSTMRVDTFSAGIIPRLFEPQAVQQWLGYCKTHHRKLCSTGIDACIRNFKVIDCRLRAVTDEPLDGPYVALSYVWGKNIRPEFATERKLRPNGYSLWFLPEDLPKVVEDSIQVTKAMGFRYLWVDKYCILRDEGDQQVSEQIQKMDLIYRGSELTLIAAAGDGENTGLPGVGNTERDPQVVVSHGDMSVISTLPHPHHVIKGSEWMKRGWTLQESILSRRRLVFTKDQLYFECNAMNCFEGIHSPLDQVHTQVKDRFLSFMRGGLFNGRDEGFSDQTFGVPFGSFDDLNRQWSYYIRKYIILAKNYTSRELSRDSDSLNAFRGIMSQLQASKYPMSQLLGLPYLELTESPDDYTDLNCIVAALCWRHIDCCWSGGGLARRRNEFPSWTWAGWAGTVSWTDLFTYTEMDLQSLLDHFRLELDDNTLVTIHDYSPQYHSRHLDNAKCALRFSAWPIDPEKISLDESNGYPLWKIDSFEWELHISEFSGTPGEFLQALRIGRLECVFVAKGLYNSYFLIIEPQGASYTRIGAAEALFFNDGVDRRFANGFDYGSKKREIRLI